MNINQVIIAGRMVREPELRFLPNGTAVCTFTVAVQRSFKNANGERESDFIPCVVFKGKAETIANHFAKGDEIGVIGRWQSRNYEGQDGKKVYLNELVVESFSFGAKSSGNTQGNTMGAGNNQNANTGRSSGHTRIDDDPFAGSGQIDISSDDLPF